MDGFPDLSAAKEAMADGRKRPRSTTPLPDLRIVNPVDLAGALVPPRYWVVEEWLPIGCVTANYGDGGTGKTLLAQQLMTSTALQNGVWCGMDVMHCRSIGLFCEDDEAELHRRQVDICAAYGCSLSDLDAMRWVSGVGEDNALITFEDDQTYTTPLYDALHAAAYAHGAQLIVVDTAADLFPGNENDRHQVRQFIGKLNRLAIDLNAAVLLNAHPSRTGLSNGNFDGGSTGWNNSVRSRWSLSRPVLEEGEAEDPDARLLTRRKANYARIGDEIPLRWERGVLVAPNAAVSGGGQIDRAAAEIVFLDLLASRWEQGVYVSHSTRAGNYAPKVFGQSAERKGYSVKDFAAAMGRLFDVGRIKAEYYGRNGDMRQRITPVADETSDEG